MIGNSFRKFFWYSLGVLACCLVSACAQIPSIQPQINSLVVAGRNDLALATFEEHSVGYGSHNRLLYLMDYGAVLHYTGHYRESINVFEEAKRVYQQLYTRSVSKYAATWAANDYADDYRGEDFERVMINIFQALNFAAQGDFEEALVEARDVDNQLKIINQQYPPDKQNVYREDAFARFLMGILYEASGSRADLDDALISYQKALDVYHQDYEKVYHVEAPRLLKENLSALKRMRLAGKEGLATVYVIHYRGLSPVKHQVSFPIPLPDGHLARFAFPKYDRRVYPQDPGELKAESSGGKKTSAGMETAQDISAIAIQSLENRRVRVMAKAVLRMVAKQAALQSVEHQLRKEQGDTAANIWKYAGNAYAFVSEQADLRSWQTLPAKIDIGKLVLEPGHYTLSLDEKILAEIDVGPGDFKFIFVRTGQ